MGDILRQRAVTKRTSVTTEGKLNSATTDSPPTIITVHDLISAYFARPLQNSIPRRTHSAAMAACYAKLLPQFRHCEHVIHMHCFRFRCSRCLSRRRRCIKLDDDDDGDDDSVSRFILQLQVTNSHAPATTGANGAPRQWVTPRDNGL